MHELSIQQWLESIDPALGCYAGQFMELGYDNVKLLSMVDESELSDDLKEMKAKKLHCRLILKRFAELKAEPQAPPRRPEMHSSTNPWECPRSELARLGQSLGSVQRVPVWWLRFTQSRVNGQMVFSSGHQDRSVYELLHELLSGRQSIDELPPLEVVLDGHLYSMDNRRLLALLLLQGCRRHQRILARCRVLSPTDPRVAERYSQRIYRLKKDGSEGFDQGSGLGVALHSLPSSEAWHLGSPLFRRTGEWCDESPAALEALAVVPVRRGLGHELAYLERGPLHRGEASKPMNAEADFFACEERTEKVAQDSCVAPASAKGKGEASLKVVQGMLVRVHDGGDVCYGKVMEINCGAEAPVKVKFFSKAKAQAWLCLTSVLIPDYAAIQVGMEVTVLTANKRQVEKVTDVDHARQNDPVQVSLDGLTGTKWVGADRLRSKVIEFLPAKLSDESCAPQEEPNPENGKAAGSDKQAATVCCMWLAGECQKTESHSTGKRLYLHEDIPGMPCGQGQACKFRHFESREQLSQQERDAASEPKDAVPILHTTLGPAQELAEGMLVKVQGGKEDFAKVVAVNRGAEAPVKVCYLNKAKADAWLCLKSLSVPDYSAVKVGQSVCVSCSGSWKLAAVLAINHAFSRWPVQVKVQGLSDVSKWVGADELRSKVITFVPAKLSGDCCAPQEEPTPQNGKVAGSDKQAATVCCMWLAGECQKTESHSTGKRLYLHEDIPGMPCGQGQSCKFRHFESRELLSQQERDAASEPKDAVPILHTTLGPGQELAEGMLVKVQGGKEDFAEVVAVNRGVEAPVKVCYLNKAKADAWLCLNSLSVPDYAAVKVGLQVTVKHCMKWHSGTVKAVNPSSSRSPVQVTVNGQQNVCEWVGAERLRTSALTFRPATMSKIQQQISESLVATRGASLQTEVFRRAHSGLAEGMLVKVEDVNKEQFAEVLELSNGTEPPAKVRFLNATKADSWLCLKSLAIPDYAAVQVGLQVNVNYGGIWMLGSVIAINHAFTRSPVQVKVHGLPPGATKWVGADELRSKAIKFLPANLADGIENGPAGSGKRNVSVCCRWLAGTCLRAESHSMFNNLYLHEDVPGIPCALGHECKFRHFETRGLPSHPGSAEASTVGASCQNVEAPRAKNPGPGEARWKPVALASNLGRAQGRAGPRATADAPGLSDLSASSQLPWTSLDADPEGLEHGLQAAIDALEALLQVSAAAPEELAKLQQAARSQLVRPILEAHSWTGSQFASDADLHAVLAQLKVAKAEVDDDVTSCSDQSEHEESDFEENLSTCAESAGLETLERRLAAQQEEFREITGVLVFGTFRCVSGDKQHSNSGEVLVERGPRLLLGRRVRVIGSCRAAAFDQDQVYLRLLMGKFFPLDGHARRAPGPMTAGQLARTELYGRVLHASGTSRQRLFVCCRTKMVRNKNQMTFKPINGKLPPISVPLHSKTGDFDRFDLHLVEVLHWREGQRPRGVYRRALKMKSRQSDAEILEVVKLSMNLTDWEPEEGTDLRLAVEASQRRAEAEGARRDLRGTAPAVGVQHLGMPTALLFSETTQFLQIHVLDVNAYLDTPRLEEAELAARKRAVGMWFLDHLDQPLEGAALPLLPPDCGLSFKEGKDSLAMSFFFPKDALGQLQDEVQVLETLVRCDRLLSPDSAGNPILHAGLGGDSGDLLRSLFRHACCFEEDLESQGFAAMEYLDLRLKAAPDCRADGRYAATVGIRLLDTLTHMVDVQMARLLTDGAWRHLLEADGDAGCLRYARGRWDPQNWRVLERLVRVKPNRGVSFEDAKEELDAILKQPGLSAAQKSALSASFYRRLCNALPDASYVVSGVPGGRSQEDIESGVFRAASPLHRYVDLLGMRALKTQLGWRPKCPHLRLPAEALAQVAATTNARLAAHGFAVYIFRQISWMRELAPCDVLVQDAVLGAVGPSYMVLLIPKPSTQALELKVPVAALRSAACGVDYEPPTQSLKFQTSEGTWAVSSWSSQRVSCVVARNFAQPIPHHAAPGAVIVSHVAFLVGRRSISFGLGHKMYPEVFSSWPDLGRWKDLDRDLGTYAATWSKIRLCQVHAAAAASVAYTAPAHLRTVTWVRGPQKRWRFKCTASIQVSDVCQWIAPSDLALLMCSRGGGAGGVTVYGLIEWVKKKGCSNGVQDFDLEVELSEIGHLIREAQQGAVLAATDFQLQLIAVPANEKKAVELLRTIPEKPPLGALRLQEPSARGARVEAEAKPLASRQQVEAVLRRPAFPSASALNGEQLLAVQRGLQRPFSTVQGPPGTGKTSFLVSLIASTLSLELHSQMKHREPPRLLVLAPSNHAVDEIVRRLVRDTEIPGHYVTRIYSRSIENTHGDSFKGSPQLRHDVFDVKPDVVEHALHQKASQVCYDSSKKNLYEQAELRVLRSSRVVVTTVTNSYLHTALNKVTMWNGKMSHVQHPIKFTSVIVDEAAQASEPDVVLSFMSAGYRVVVVGDHKQLGPVIPERNLCTSYVSALETPFLERMLQKPQRHSANTLLNVQYRMHPSIRRFPSIQFYDSKLRDSVSMPHRPELCCLWPQRDEHVLFVDCQTPQTFGAGDKSPDGVENKVSLKNVGEAKLVLETCTQLLEAGCSPKDIAIITPYTAQQQEIRTRLAKRPDSRNILVGTVHALQGSEREYIIISFVRSFVQDEYDIHSADSSGMILSTDKQSKALRDICSCKLGILSNNRLLNVSLTRARYGLVCIGNRSVLSNGSRDFFDYTQGLAERGCVVDRLNAKGTAKRRGG